MAETKTLQVEIQGENKASSAWDLPRSRALQLAIDSAASFESPPSPEHIVARAETFLAFLDPHG